MNQKTAKIALSTEAHATGCRWYSMTCCCVCTVLLLLLLVVLVPPLLSVLLALKMNGIVLPNCRPTPSASRKYVAHAGTHDTTHLKLHGRMCSLPILPLFACAWQRFSRPTKAFSTRE